MIYPEKDPELNAMMVKQLEMAGTRVYMEETGLTHYLNPEGWLMTDMNESEGLYSFSVKVVYKFEFRDDMSTIELHYVDGDLRLTGKLQGMTGATLPLTMLRERANEFGRSLLDFGSW